MINLIAKQVGLVLLLTGIVTGEALKNEERLSYNASRREASMGMLSTRDLFGLDKRAWECNPGYTECAYDSSRCCPTTGRCCGTGYCADSDEVCCTVGGTCPSGYNCCGTSNCSPKSGECCSDGRYCLAGYKCMIQFGKGVCCPKSGCIGSDNSGDASSGSSATETDTKTLTTTTATYQYHSYYYTTYYW
jgi:hypothetical protein